jgi:hypothetical protein
MFMTLVQSLLGESADRDVLLGRIKYNANRTIQEEQLASNTLRLLSTFFTMHMEQEFPIESLVFENFQKVPPPDVTASAITVEQFAERFVVVLSWKSGSGRCARS